MVGFFLKILAIFNKKIRLFVNGRKTVFKELDSFFSHQGKDEVIWFHCASLGEFEQGRPIIEKCKEQFSNFKILITFFSPSGYEIRKEYAMADKIVYLPLDTKKNAKRFLDIVNPKVAIFIKYEFWPNILKQLKSKNIKTILVSANFRKEQTFFKSYGSWMKKSLKSIDHFFLQNSTSQKLLREIGFENTTVSGDTRFDRVYDITKQNYALKFAQEFKDDKTTLVAGSTWQKDEVLLVNYINDHSGSDQKFILAPHNVKPKQIEELKQRLNKKTILFSQTGEAELRNFQVLIMDNIGMLSKIYNYGDIAYVGGGFGSGIHNILEPATFSIPIIIGPNYHKFNEAKELINLGACVSISNKLELNSELKSLFENADKRASKSSIAGNYILKNIGATEIIMNYLHRIISKN